MSTFEIRHLRAFLAVAEELHFGRAAAQLHLTQSSLSAQIAHLEAQLGVRLFERTTRRVRLTPAGELMLPRARRALSAFRGAERLGEQLRAGQLGALSIGSTPRARTLPAWEDAIAGLTRLRTRYALSDGGFALLTT